MKILFISTSIPPCEDMQTTRNIYLIKSLLKEGNTVDVLTCGKYIKGQSSFDKILEKVNVLRTEFPFIYRWHKAAQRIFNHTPLLRIHNVLINCYAKPDLYSGWDKKAIKKLEDMTLSNYDICITSSGSYAAHIVGYKWKQLYHGKWVGEYGDPWGINAYGGINKKYYSQERQLIKMCDGIVLTTPATVEAYKKAYGTDIPYCLVPCGFDRIIEDSRQKSSEDILYTYTGVAYKKARNLGYFLGVACSRKKTRVKIVGSYSDDYKEEFGRDNIEFTGRVKYQDSLQMLSEADVLVHIGNFGKLQVPGKTYIYLSTMKPILYIQQEEKDDPTFKVLSEFGGVVFAKNNSHDINTAMEYIDEHYDKLKEEAIDRAQSPDLHMYNWDTLGKEFSDFVTRIYNNEISQENHYER